MKYLKGFWPLFLFSLSWLFYCLYSFSQKDLNLTIYNFGIAAKFQDLMIQLGYFNRPLSTWIFVILSLLICLSYLLIVLKFYNFISKKLFIIILGFISLTGILAYPMVSRDIFNYLFNAKMILVYGQSPYVHAAWDFPQDDWLRFMHNIHTPTPYGYVWTAISLIPIKIGLPKFTTSLLAMKVFLTIFTLFQTFLVYKIANLIKLKNPWQRTLLVGLNPLLLTESILVGHNDIVMPTFALLGFYFLYQRENFKNKFFAGFFWLASVLSKLATVILAPLYLFYKKVDVFFWGGLGLFAVILTRTSQFNSWYFVWSIPFLMLSKKSWAVTFGVLISLGGLLRYAPFIYFGHWDPPVNTWRLFIFLAPLLGLLFKKVRLWFS